MDHATDGRRDGEAHAVGEAVASVEELKLEYARFNDIIFGDGVRVAPASRFGLAQLHLDEAAGQRSGVDGCVNTLFQQIGKGADVIFMAVGQEDASHIVKSCQHIVSIGNNDVDAVHVAAGEHEADVDDDKIVARFHHHHVLADFA